VALPTPTSGRAWIQVALIAVGLLVLPLVAWLAFPSSARVDTAPSASALAEDTAAPQPLPTDAPDEEAGTRKLAGHVLDADGAAVAGATVVAASPGHPPHETTTRADGAFSVDATTTDVSLSARKEGFAQAHLEVPAGGAVLDLELRLHVAAAVAGVVVDAAGKPVSGAFVECDGTEANATTDDAGHFELPAAADGCRATAMHPELGRSSPTELSAGDRNRIEMVAPGGITGSVADELGHPVPRYLLSIESFVPLPGSLPAPWGRGDRVDDPGGNFSLEGLSAGKYVLVASAEGRPPAKSDPIDVEAGRVTSGVTIVLDKGGTLSGIVTDRDTHRPIVGVRVRLDAVTSSGASAVRPGVTDETGTYHLDGVPNGPFSVRLSHGDYNDRIVSLDGSNSHDLHEDIDLSPAGDGPSTEMTGIGATLGMGDKFVDIVSVLPGGPAEAAGLLPEDRIMRIDGASAEGFTVSDCVQRLRGPEGTRVSVTLGRGTSTVELTITRAKIVR